MSGHSKWATIKRQKGAADVKRGQTFTKISNAITIAVRQGGGVTDPASNFRLRLVIEKARGMNMPKDNIERAIARAAGKLSGENVEEVVYEGFGPGKVAVMVEAVTDNKLRTANDIKNVFDKSGGTLGSVGTVSYLFQSMGQITIIKNSQISSDDMYLRAADTGALDVEEAGNSLLVYTKPEELARVKDGLLAQGLSIQEFELTRKPVSTMTLSDLQTWKKLQDFLERLENLDDVQKVYANFEVPDELLGE